MENKSKYFRLELFIPLTLIGGINKIKLRLIAVLVITAGSIHTAIGQPYIDVLNARFMASPSSFITPTDTKSLQYINISTNFPIRIKESILLISPFVDRWILPSAITGKQLRLTSLALPVTLIIPSGNNWKLATTVIFRINDSMPSSHGQVQFGGAVLGEKKISESLQFRVGIYLNAELFGLFVVPLAGIDWKISNRSNLFGLLPGGLTYEYHLSKSSYTGLAFRTFTNSYGVNNNYYRIDENQLGTYYDFYLTKKLVINAEIGHSILRKIRTGEYHEKGAHLDVNDAWYFKTAIAYRIRLR